MAKHAGSSNTASFQPPKHRPSWVVFSTCLLLGLLLGVALLDFAPNQSVQVMGSGTMAKNAVGRLGAETSWWLFRLFGLSTWLIPVFLLWIAYISIRNVKHLVTARLVAMGICLVADSTLAAMVESYPRSDYFSAGLGGLIGSVVYGGLLQNLVGDVGTVLIMGAVSVVTVTFVFVKDIAGEFDKMAAAFAQWRDQQAERRAERAEVKRQLREAQERERRQKAATGSLFEEFKMGQAPAATPTETEEKPAKPVPLPKAAKATDDDETPARATKGDDAKRSDSLDTKAAKIELKIVKPEEPAKATKAAVQKIEENYEFPPLKLLREPVRAAGHNSKEEHRQNAENLLRILGEFGVEVTLGEIHVGPVITRYEVVPAAGVRVEKIAGLDKNIALGMRAQSVRILAPIPGKAAVGVEVPNQRPTPVGMREILESEDWAEAKSELPIALGKDVSGKPLISDLTKMPHLLIAGATGSGKSVCINSIVASILYSKSPRDVKLLMVDPKIVELKIFNTLPHMLIPVVTEPKKVPAALKWLLREMEQRYQIFAKVGVRNILGFNNRKKGGAPEVPPQAEIQQGALPGVDPLDELIVPDRLPYIVAIIDELADLMMVAPAEVETSIARLAQLARAAGIHLIIATQRPSVNVITGVIKANLPSRIAFQVASQVDSRTILDTKGADTLIGRGDMLFSPPGSSRLVRAQGAFVSDEEVQELVEFLKRNGPPQYAQDVQAQIDRDPEAEEDEFEGEDGEAGDDEVLVKQAIGVLKSTRRASTSMLQRRLRIGYNRAARVMELMEEKGIVGPENGSSPREILVDLDQL
ncbi:DNA translocase FtsK 4TM domain-containing protein [Nibricoccus sp. IMCC34717]|uniref:FtsK/SpoIIIE family DNA translocase n=1 Tax=Nibricoccus sp. IMCC34717 TaxID=3034021 RepID=UPI003850316E